ALGGGVGTGMPPGGPPPSGPGTTRHRPHGGPAGGVGGFDQGSLARFYHLGPVSGQPEAAGSQPGPGVRPGCAARGTVVAGRAPDLWSVRPADDGRLWQSGIALEL